MIDSCTHVLIVDIDQSADVKRENVYLGGMSLAERCRIFKEMDVGTVICGGISATFAQMLTSSDIGFVKLHLSVFRVVKTTNEFYQSAFSRPVGSEQSDDLAAAHVKRDPPQGLNSPIKNIDL